MSEEMRRLFDVFKRKPCREPSMKPTAETPEQLGTRMASYGVPPEFRRAHIGDFANHHPSYDVGEWFWERHPFPGPRSVFLVGANGSGKSHMAAALCGEWRGAWVSVRELVLRVRATYHHSAEETELGIMRDMTRPSVLVLDDLTAAKLTEHGLSVVLGVVAARAEELKHTLVTSHHSLADIDAVDTALASRLAHFALARFRGRDRRKER